MIGCTADNRSSPFAQRVATTATVAGAPALSMSDVTLGNAGAQAAVVVTSPTTGPDALQTITLRPAVAGSGASVQYSRYYSIAGAVVAMRVGSGAVTDPVTWLTK